MERAEGKALLATKRERPAQALLELAILLASAHKQGWALTALGCTLETTPAGEATANVRATSPPANSS